MMDIESLNMGLYDSDTGESLKATKVVDITDLQQDYPLVLLAYTQAKRGRIVQLVRCYDADDSTGTRIHYFFDEPGGARMIEEDEERFGFIRTELTDSIALNAPELS